MDIIKVSGSSRTSAVAGAIAGVFRENHHAEVQAIGAGAVNQAVKALVLARGYLAADGLDVIFTPEFVDVEIDDKTRTAIRLTVELREGTDRPPAPTPRMPAVEENPTPTPYASPEPEESTSSYSTSYQEGVYKEQQSELD